MDIEYKDVIDFTRCKKLLEERGIKVKFLAEKTGQTPTRMSQILKNNTFPKTDLIAKMCSVLKAAPSEIVRFKIDEDEKKKLSALAMQAAGSVKGEGSEESRRIIEECRQLLIPLLHRTDSLLF